MNTYLRKIKWKNKNLYTCKKNAYYWEIDLGFTFEFIFIKLENQKKKKATSFKITSKITVAFGSFTSLGNVPVTPCYTETFLKCWFPAILFHWRTMCRVKREQEHSPYLHPHLPAWTKRTMSLPSTWVILEVCLLWNLRPVHIARN